MLARNDLDGIHVAFDDHRLVANAGLILPVTLSQHLGLRELVDNHVDLGDAPGRANPGDKMMTLVVSALAGGDCIDDADALAGPSRCWAELRRRPRWEPSCGVSGGATCASWVGEPEAAGPSLGGWSGTGRCTVDHRHFAGLRSPTPFQNRKGVNSRRSPARARSGQRWRQLASSSAGRIRRCGSAGSAT